MLLLLIGAAHASAAVPGPTPGIVSVPPSADPTPAQRAALLAAPRPPVPLPRGPGNLVTYDVVIVNPTGPIAPYITQIQRHAIAAGNVWSRFLKPAGPLPLTPRTITISVVIDNSLDRAGGRSAFTGFIENRSGYNIFEMGYAYEARTGLDLNGSQPDVEIFFNINYLANELWFDTAPTINPAAQPVPAGKTDAFSVFLHEIGHALAFNGWMNWATGDLPISPPDPNAYRSPFDEKTDWSSGAPFFFGQQAQSYYRGIDVPLTEGNVFHIANFAPGAGQELIPDLMNGVVFFRGTRYSISRLDLAICADAGVVVDWCRVDMDLSQTVAVPDIFLFLNLWFAGNYEADFNADGSISVPDIFAFLQAWFDGCA